MKTRSLPKKAKLKKSTSRRQSWLSKVELPGDYQLVGSDPACKATGTSVLNTAYNASIAAVYYASFVGCASLCAIYIPAAWEEGDPEPLLRCLEQANETTCWDFAYGISHSDVNKAAAIVAAQLAYSAWCDWTEATSIPGFGCFCCLSTSC